MECDRSLRIPRTAGHNFVLSVKTLNAIAWRHWATVNGDGLKFQEDKKNESSPVCLRSDSRDPRRHLSPQALRLNELPTNIRFACTEVTARINEIETSDVRTIVGRRYKSTYAVPLYILQVSNDVYTVIGETLVECARDWKHNAPNSICWLFGNSIMLIVKKWKIGELKLKE